MGNIYKNNYSSTQKKISIGQKRKLSKIDIRDKIFVIKKEESHKTSIHLSSQKFNVIESNDIINKNNVHNNKNKLNESDSTNKINANNNKNNSSNINSSKNIKNQNFNNINDNYENKNNMNGCIINNYINVTNNYMNNKYICNCCNNDIINNNNYHDYYNSEKNDSINIDRNLNCFGFYHCPDKNIFNIDKPFLFWNHFSKTLYNNSNSINNKINNCNENENCNNGTNPFELNFNNENNENEQ